MSNNRDERRELSLNGEGGSSEPPTPLPSLAYAVGAGSECGKKRWSNEDSLFAVSRRENMFLSTWPCGLFAVADGKGGHDDGQEASCNAIQALVDCLWPELASGNMLQPEACIAMLSEAVQKANEAVNQHNIDLNKEGRGKRVRHVGTTLTAAMLVGATAYVANVGDSRTYLYRAKEGLLKVTTDHLLVARWIEEGTLPPEALYTHGHRNQIYRVLSTHPQVEADLFTVPLQPGDVVLLCSDGLWRNVRDSEMEDILRSAPSTPSQVASLLIQTALSRGSWGDNVSVIVVSLLQAQDQVLEPDIQLFMNPDRLHLPQT